MPAPTTPHGNSPQRWFSAIVATLLALATLLMLAAAPVAAAGKTCRVRDTSSGAVYGRLQQAVYRARPGSTLVLKGTCAGQTIIGKRLTIVGVRTARLGRPTLDGQRWKSPGRPVLTVKAKATVGLRDLEIVRGERAIVNRGHLWLRAVTIRHNDGLTVTNTGTLVTNGPTRIVDNDTARSLLNRGTMRLRGSTAIKGTVSSTASSHGQQPRHARLRRPGQPLAPGPGRQRRQTGHARDERHPPHLDELLRERHLRGLRRSGGAVRNTGTLRLEERSSIHHAVVRDDTPMGSYSDPPGSYPPARGGGVYNAGTLVMQDDSSIHYNTAEALFGGTVVGEGGGVYDAAGGVLVGVRCAGPDANVFDNAPDDCFAPGGGARRRRTGPAVGAETEG